MFGKKKNEDETGLEPGADQLGVPRLTSLDIQQKEFRLAFRGYREKDVDLFLDQLTEEFTRLTEENKRVREGAGIPVVAGDRLAGEDIKRRAQEEAAAILADARARAASIENQAGGVPAAAGVPSTAGVQIFLKEEREFLHGMAGMIQKHAETIRSTAKTLQEGVATAMAAAPATSAGPVESDTAPSAPAPSPSVESAEEAAEEVAEEGAQSGAATSAWSATATSPPTAPTDTTPGASDEAAPDVVSIPPSEVDMTSLEPEAAAAGAHADAPDERGSKDKRSLRELFWGED